MYRSSWAQRACELDGLAHILVTLLGCGVTEIRLPATAVTFLHSITWVPEKTWRTDTPLCNKAVLGGLLLCCVCTNASHVYLHAV